MPNFKLPPIGKNNNDMPHKEPLKQLDNISSKMIKLENGSNINYNN